MLRVGAMSNADARCSAPMKGEDADARAARSLDPKKAVACTPTSSALMGATGSGANASVPSENSTQYAVAHRVITGCASIHGSLVCARRIARVLGRERPLWDEVRRGLGVILREREYLFRDASVPEGPGRYSMDWYYPVLGGALRGNAARVRLQAERERFIGEGVGCRCVADRAWYTVAETCELVMALDAGGLQEQGRALFEWVQRLRCKDGGYWMGISYPNQLRWPPERPSWTAATVILAADTLDGNSTTSSFFRDLAD